MKTRRLQRRMRGGARWLDALLRLKEHPKAKIEWILVAMNPSVRFEDILSHPELPWDYNAVAMNPNLTLSHIQNLIQTKSVAPGAFSSHPKITNEFVKKHQNDGLDWVQISKNPSIDITQIPKAKIRWSSVSERKDLSLEILTANMDTAKPRNNFEYSLALSVNPVITFEFMRAHSEKPWNYQHAAMNPNINWDTLVKNADIFMPAGKEKECRTWYTMNPGFQLTDEVKADVKANPKYWDWEKLSMYTPLTPALFQEFKDQWNYAGLSRNLTLTWKIINSSMNSKWDWKELSRHPNISYSIIQKFATMPWDYAYLSNNPNLSWEIVEAQIDKGWDWRALMSNPMESAAKLRAEASSIFKLKLALGSDPSTKGYIEAISNQLGPNILLYLTSSYTVGNTLNTTLQRMRGNLSVLPK